MSERLALRMQRLRAFSSAANGGTGARRRVRLVDLTAAGTFPIAAIVGTWMAVNGRAIEAHGVQIRDATDYFLVPSPDRATPKSFSSVSSSPTSSFNMLSKPLSET